MALADLLTQVVTIETPDGATVTESAFVQSINSDDDRFLRDFTEAKFFVYFHPWVSIGNNDRIIWGTRKLEVVGPPRRKHRPAGLHHLTVSAVEVEG